MYIICSRYKYCFMKPFFINMHIYLDTHRYAYILSYNKKCISYCVSRSKTASH